MFDITSKSWKINTNDPMGLLLVCYQNCIGTISVIPIDKENN